jgi:uncharacterized membrane protein YhaH (DUF805 family)
MKYYIEFWKRAFDFKGVASRPQYWYAVLINFVVLFVLSLIFAGTTDEGFGNDWVSSIYSVLILIPNISITVRRLHDINKSGWFCLLELIPLVGSLIVLIFTCLKTVKVNNRWRMNDIQRGYIKDDLFDQPLSDNQWTYKE